MPYRPLATRVGNVVRLAEIIQVMVRHGFAGIVHRLGLHEGIPARLLRGMRLIGAPEDEPGTRGQRLRAVLNDLGPTFVKLGQVLSTRPDLVPEDVSTELGKLQDRADVVPFDRMRVVLEGALGGAVSEIFAAFDETPVASASLSQVYRAELKTGESVAVKVQRPDIRRVIESDLSLVRRAAEWASEHMDELGWAGPCGDCGRVRAIASARELDFTSEARIIERFRLSFADRADVFVPKAYMELTAPEVLTMGWIDGVRIDALDQFAERESDPKTVAVAGCDLVCAQIFEQRLFHADPHPGNILLTRANRVAFLDYGMVGHLERSDVVALAELLRAVFENDPERCVQALLGFTAAGDVYDRDSFRHAIGEFIAFEAQTLVGGAQVGRLLRELTAVLRRYHLELASRLSLLLKALATIESTGRLLDPDLDLTPILRPYVERVLTSQFAPSRVRRELQQQAGALVRLARELPLDVQQVIRLLRRGQFRMRIEPEGLSHFGGVVDRASNRLTFGVITGAIIVGSSLLIHAGPGHSTLGIVGYLFAGVLGVGLMVSILRSRNF